MSIFRDDLVRIHSQRNVLSPYKRRLDVSAEVKGTEDRIVWHDNDGSATFSKGDTFEINCVQVDDLSEYKDALEEKIWSSYQVLSAVDDYFETLPPAKHHFIGQKYLCTHSGPVYAYGALNCRDPYIDEVYFFDIGFPFDTVLNGNTKRVSIQYDEGGNLLEISAAESLNYPCSSRVAFGSCCGPFSPVANFIIDLDSPDRELVRGVELYFQFNIENLDPDEGDGLTACH